MTSETDSISSNLDTFDAVYRITPIINPGTLGLWYLASASTAPYMASPGATNIYTSGAYYNTSTYPVNISGWNTQSFVDNAGSIRSGSSEYLFLANKTKTNKIFFNNTPYAKDFMSNLSTTTSGNVLTGVFYLVTGQSYSNDPFTQNAEWKPVAFTDTTQTSIELTDTTNKKFVEYSDTLTKPGFIEFDMPSDWAKVSVSGLTGGAFDVTSGVPDTSSGSFFNLAKDITFALDGSLATTQSGFHEYELSDSTSALSKYTNDEIGKFNYTFQVKDGTHNGQIFWVTSGNTVSEKIYLLSGNTSPPFTNSADWTKGIMRRVNIYDVFDGSVKTGNLGGMIGVANSSLVGGQPYTFMMSSSAMVNDMKQNLTNVYPLKIVTSGNHFPSGGNPGSEIWDILPYNNTSSELITQYDNTAYDLSYMAITSDVSVTYAGTYYQAISKGGRVFIKRTGTPIQSINFGGNALGDESTAGFSDANSSFSTYDTLRLLRKIEAEGVRVMWDEIQKDGSFVRFFGYVSTVGETHQAGGRRASKPYNFTMIIQEICLIDSAGKLMSDIEPLGGVSDDKSYQ